MPSKSDLEHALVAAMIPMTDDEIFYRIMLYGDGGVGKTKTSTDFGEHILYVDADPMGWVTLMNHPKNMRKCTRIKFQGLSQLDTLVNMWSAGDERVILNKNGQPHDLIVVDTITGVATWDLDITMKAREKAGTRKMGEYEPVSLPDYGVSGERIRRMLMGSDNGVGLLNLPVNIVLTAHPREDTVVGLQVTRPGFTPKLRQDVERMMTLIAYMTAVEGKEDDNGLPTYQRKLQVHATKTIGAKSRIGGLPAILTDPDLPKIVNDWVAKGAHEEDEEVVEEILPVIVSDSPNDNDVLSGLEIG